MQIISLYWRTIEVSGPNRPKKGETAVTKTIQTRIVMSLRAPTPLPPTPPLPTHPPSLRDSDSQAIAKTVFIH